MKARNTLRERLAVRVLGIVTWILPAQHPAILSLYKVAAEIENP
jgi:hypothetical protein